MLESWTLVANDLLTGGRWMEVRKAQRPARQFGAAPAAALDAWRKSGRTSYNFIRTTPATAFYAGGPAMPETTEPALKAIAGGRP